MAGSSLSISFIPMLKLSLKLSEKKRHFQVEDEDCWHLDADMESGEELATFRAGRCRSEEEEVEMCFTGDEDPDQETVPENIRRGTTSHFCNSLEFMEDTNVSELEYELSQDVINLGMLRCIARSGLPDVGGFRATVWKQLLLGYLPAARNSWQNELTEKRQKYAALKKELLLNPTEFTRMKYELLGSKEDERDCRNGFLRRCAIPLEDHPLSLVKASVWNQYFQDIEMAEQIDRDLQRTHPGIRFFSGDFEAGVRNKEAMRNILMLFAKLNPATGYVQGMHEVLAPLYYVFRTDPDNQNFINAEADSFFCFLRLLSDAVDHFCQQLDNSSVGILSTLSRLSELLRINDPQLWQHLEIHNKVKPQFFAFRWITLLLTQEFHFNVITRIWDSLISHPLGIQGMLLRVCCAMLVCVKNELLRGDFAENLKLLLHYPCLDIEHVLVVAEEISFPSYIELF